MMISATSSRLQQCLKLAAGKGWKENSAFEENLKAYEEKVFAQLIDVHDQRRIIAEVD